MLLITSMTVYIYIVILLQTSKPLKHQFGNAFFFNEKYHNKNIKNCNIVFAIELCITIMRDQTLSYEFTYGTAHGRLWWAPCG